MLSKDEVQKALDTVCKRYNLKKATLFGSYAHGTATEDSDVDVLIELADKTNWFDMKLNIMRDLEDMLGKRVDVLVAPLPEGSIFILDENGVPIFVTSEERTSRLLPFIARYITKIKKQLEGISKDEFLHNEILGDAICMKIIKLADKMKGISSEYLNEHPEFPRQEIIDMRNRLAHFYWKEVDGEIIELEINYGEVWDCVMNTILPLEDQLIAN